MKPTINRHERQRNQKKEIVVASLGAKPGVKLDAQKIGMNPGMEPGSQNWGMKPPMKPTVKPSMKPHCKADHETAMKPGMKPPPWNRPETATLKFFSAIYA